MVNNWGDYKWSKEKMKEYDLKRRLADPIGSLIRGCEKRAKMKGIEFNMTRADLGEIPTHCPVLGLKLKYDHVGRRIAESASIDRFNNDLGYISGNVRIISNRANELKNNGTLEEFLKIVRYLQTND